MTRIAGLVLAGGAARRLGGGDKPLLPVGGQAMLARILRTLSADLDDIAISANGDPSRFAAFGRPVLADGGFAGQGPLAGILAGLDWAAGLGRDALLSVPGDTPFIPAGLAAHLVPAPSCVVHDGRTHHLVALWPVLARDALRALLASPADRKVAAFAAAIGMRRVDFEAGRGNPFTNVNTGDELAAARLAVEGADDADGGDRGAGGDRPAAGKGAG
jgi:molybdopterin-guanine dinucleotide biosynthesis protein A